MDILLNPLDVSEAYFWIQEVVIVSLLSAGWVSSFVNWRITDVWDIQQKGPGPILSLFGTKVWCKTTCLTKYANPSLDKLIARNVKQAWICMYKNKSKSTIR